MIGVCLVNKIGDNLVPLTDYVRCASTIMQQLQDEESKQIFGARLNYLFDRNEDKFYEVIDSLGHRISSTEKCINNLKGKSIVLILYSDFVNRTVNLLNDLGIHILAICCKGREYDLDNRVTLKEIVSLYKEAHVLIVGSNLQKYEAYHFLVNNGFGQDRIFVTAGEVFVNYGCQYFDLEELVKRKDEEIFVDAGCYDGMDSLQFQLWSSANIKRILAFEPDKDNYNICESNLKRYCKADYELFNFGVWDREEELVFQNDLINSYESKIAKTGNLWSIQTNHYESDVLKTDVNMVKVNSIDKVLAGRKATFIKMDVEGAEVQALLGAKDTIRKFKPRLAISIYHRPNDILEIPRTINEIRNDYLFYLRHYCSNMSETVLYCI